MSIEIIFQILFSAYLVLVTVFLISENRAPKSTFAWMLLFIILPIFGLVIYLFVGRGYQTFARHLHLKQQGSTADIRAVLQDASAQHDAALALMEKEQSLAARVATLVNSNASSRITTSNRIAVLQDAEATYPVLVAAMEQAKSSIHLSFYILNDDVFGNEVLTVLIRKASQGLHVRILFDPIGSFRGLSQRYLRNARAAGIEIHPSPSLWQVQAISYRNHRKIAVIDGSIGFTGGLNIGDEYLDPPKGFDRWRDTHVRLTGSAVWSLQAIFLTEWENATGEILDPAHLFPAVSPPDRTANLPVQICLSGPDTSSAAIRQLYFELIVSAKSQVLIQSPFFILDETLAEALKLKALSGVDVQVMISPNGPRQFLPFWAANTYALDVARAGVKVHHYTAGFMHAKTVCVDGEISSIGSANWDIRSFSINYELTAVIYDGDVSQQLVEAFGRDLVDCRPFDVERYQSLGHLLRFRDSVARLASPLL
ncbi:cardiolipin synthase [Sulfitobacter guttiformis]|uniref:Cardiolipin synthase n=1 Tax=Sulfitobacter guttiformis TaxID=74349 RepID=A0A420DJ50_9RHOB|nr:cardiolipin synthase [Sulfitobacter guttiformis]KIN71922.1 Phospholipase D/Transphosphatidylase [Sulfitobacter guttiformis KCTC 32187]RKE94270.1 cardiolipin synthetase 2 [Sulfitobacter guttiformis]